MTDNGNGEIDEVVLAEQAKADPAAFAELYDRRSAAVFRFAWRRLGSREAAEDATSAIFVRALEAIESYRGGSFVAWLFAIARATTANMARRQVAAASTSAPDTNLPAPNSDAWIEAIETEDQIRGLLARLTTEQRQVVELRLAGLTGREIAESLGRSHGAIKMLQLRAFETMRRFAGDARQDDADDRV